MTLLAPGNALSPAAGVTDGPTGPALRPVRRALLSWLTVIALLSLAAWIA